jgi:hypothetical protein
VSLLASFLSGCDLAVQFPCHLGTRLPCIGQVEEDLSNPANLSRYRSEFRHDRLARPLSDTTRQTEWIGIRVPWIPVCVGLARGPPGILGASPSGMMRGFGCRGEERYGRQNQCNAPHLFPSKQ